jgi:hypothetical protein
MQEPAVHGALTGLVSCPAGIFPTVEDRERAIIDLAFVWVLPCGCSLETDHPTSTH